MKIVTVYVGDTYKNSAGTIIKVLEILDDGTALIKADEYKRPYKYKIDAIVRYINNDTYTEYTPAIPNEFVVRITRTRLGNGRTMYNTVRSLLHKFYDAGLLGEVPRVSVGNYLYYNKSKNTLTVVGDHFIRSNALSDKIIAGSTFLPIYVETSKRIKEFKKHNKNGKEKSENRESRREQNTAELNLNKKTETSTESRRSNERKIGLLSEDREVTIKGCKTRIEIRIKSSEERVKIPAFKWGNLGPSRVCRS